MPQNLPSITQTWYSIQTRGSLVIKSNSSTNIVRPISFSRRCPSQRAGSDFLPNAIHTDPTDLGNLVTVALEVTIDSGGTTFSVFLPTFDVPRGQSVEFKTIGIYKEVRGPVILPAQPRVT